MNFFFEAKRKKNKNFSVVLCLKSLSKNHLNLKITFQNLQNNFKLNNKTFFFICIQCCISSFIPSLGIVYICRIYDSTRKGFIFIKFIFIRIEWFFNISKNNQAFLYIYLTLIRTGKLP